MKIISLSENSRRVARVDWNADFLYAVYPRYKKMFDKNGLNKNYDCHGPKRKKKVFLYVVSIGSLNEFVLWYSIKFIFIKRLRFVNLFRIQEFRKKVNLKLLITQITKSKNLGRKLEKYSIESKN